MNNPILFLYLFRDYWIYGCRYLPFLLKPLFFFYDFNTILFLYCLKRHLIIFPPPPKKKVDFFFFLGGGSIFELTHSIFDFMRWKKFWEDFRALLSFSATFRPIPIDSGRFIKISILKNPEISLILGQKWCFSYFRGWLCKKIRSCIQGENWRKNKMQNTALKKSDFFNFILSFKTIKK